MKPLKNAYQKSHPWLNFELRLEHSGHRLWLLLGEAASKIEHIAHVPMRGSIAQELHRIYLIKGVLATTAIEGNTLTEEQIARRIAGKRELPPSLEYQGQEVDNIVAAMNDAIQCLPNDDWPPLTRDWICAQNRVVMRGLPMEPGAVAGVTRTHLEGNARTVGVGTYRAVPAEDCDLLLDRLCEWLNSSVYFPVDHSMRMPLAILRAIVGHLYLAWIHPFGDGNGRTARLLEFRLMLEAGSPVPPAHLLSDHYNRTRPEYYRQLDCASASGGDLVPFMEYCTQGLVDGLKEQLARIWEHQWRLAWESFVHKHDQLKGDSPKTVPRRRHLLLDLSEVREPVAAQDLESISPRVAREYARLQTQTLMRDIRWLLERGFVRTRDGKYEANRELVLAFLPKRSGSSPTTEKRKPGRPRKRENSSE